LIARNQSYSLVVAVPHALRLALDMPGRSHRRTTTSKTHAVPPPPVRRESELAALTEEWWRSWRRANALGWDYLDAMSGLMRMNLSAITRASRLVPPFDRP